MLRMINKIAIALEVSEDRQHCSIVAAGRLDETIVIELAAYLDGTDPVQAVQRIHSDRKVVATVVDPHSNAATTIALLKAAGVKVTEPSSTDLAVAHGHFIDGLRAGKIRHLGQERLTAAVRHLEQRRLGGASAPERRGAATDVSPAVAAELAVWGLEHAPKPVVPFVLSWDDLDAAEPI